MIVFISLVILIVSLIIGIPVPFAFFATTFYMIIVGGYDPSFLLPYGFYKESTIVLLAIPLFIMAGGIIEKGNIGRALIRFVEMFVGRIKGSLGAVMVVSSAVFGSISGSAAATMTVIGTIMLPQLDRAGYSKGFSASLISNCCLLGGIIPPSSLMILYAWVGQQSVIACFLAGVIPGIILTSLMVIMSIFLVRKDPNIETSEKLDSTAWRKEFSKRTYYAIPALLMPVLILGGIYGGLVTPTEAAAVAVLYSIPIGMFVYKGMNRKDLFSVLVNTATTTGVIMVMLFTVMILCRIYIMEDVPGMLMNMITSISDNKYIIMLMINLFLLIMGMLMDDVSATLLSTPILLPIVQQIGVSPIQFSAILLLNLSLGCVTPPCAPLMYLASRMGKVPVTKMLYPTAMIILFAWIPTLLLVTFIPQISLFLPRLLLGIN